MNLGRCPVCGIAHSTCGTPSVGRPVDIPQERVGTVGELRKYTVTIGRNTTVMKLNEQDAKAFGDDAVPLDAKPAAKSKQVQNKARTANDKGSTDGPAGDNR